MAYTPARSYLDYLPLEIKQHIAEFTGSLEVCLIFNCSQKTLWKVFNYSPPDRAARAAANNEWNTILWMIENCHKGIYANTVMEEAFIHGHMRLYHYLQSILSNQKVCWDKIGKGILKKGDLERLALQPNLTATFTDREYAEIARIGNIDLVQRIAPYIDWSCVKSLLIVTIIHSNYFDLEAESQLRMMLRNYSDWFQLGRFFTTSFPLDSIKLLVNVWGLPTDQTILAPLLGNTWSQNQSRLDVVKYFLQLECYEAFVWLYQSGLNSKEDVAFFDEHIVPLIASVAFSNKTAKFCITHSLLTKIPRNNVPTALKYLRRDFIDCFNSKELIDWVFTNYPGEMVGIPWIEATVQVMPERLDVLDHVLACTEIYYGYVELLRIPTNHSLVPHIQELYPEAFDEERTWWVFLHTIKHAEDLDIMLLLLPIGFSMLKLFDDTAYSYYSQLAFEVGDRVLQILEIEAEEEMRPSLTKLGITGCQDLIDKGLLRKNYYDHLCLMADLNEVEMFIVYYMEETMAKQV